MEEWQLRVLDERDALLDKYNNLYKFYTKAKGEAKVSREELDLLYLQWYIMGQYISILEKRIYLWEWKKQNE